ncbi:MAG: hypothetical protein U5L46_03945 [Agrobacterium sp.]|nr:hypothetical protein [Agrobacterium sp.]
MRRRQRCKAKLESEIARWKPVIEAAGQLRRLIGIAAIAGRHSAAGRPPSI